jgi:carboxylesterase type B
VPNLTPFNGADFYQPRYNAIISRVNCSSSWDTLACLRTIPYEELNAAINSTVDQANTNWWPIVDGDFIRKYTSLQLESGDFVKVPVLIGANADEGTSYAPVGIDTEATLRNTLLYGGLPSSFVDQLLTVYPDNEANWIPQTLPAGVQLPGTYGGQYRRAAA